MFALGAMASNNEVVGQMVGCNSGEQLQVVGFIGFRKLSLGVGGLAVPCEGLHL